MIVVSVCHVSALSPPFRLHIVGMNVLALHGRSHHPANILTVFDDRVALRQIYKRKLMTDWDVVFHF